MSSAENNTSPRRVLLEEWLPAAAVGIECMRENSVGLHPPPNRLHVWWARRPLTVSRAAVLGSLLPADFDRCIFEQLLGFYAPGETILQNALKLENNRDSEKRIPNPHGPRAFSNTVPLKAYKRLEETLQDFWGDSPLILDPMAGGGSIPLEAARMGIDVMANELNPVACVILEVTLNLAIEYGTTLEQKTRKWAKIWYERFKKRMAPFYASTGVVPPWTYIYARTVPCPDTGYPTPLVPDWHLLKPKSGRRLAAVPVVDKNRGTWTVEIREVGTRAGQVKPPQPTYKGGKGISLFSGRPISAEYIKAKAQAGEMGSALYAVALKSTKLE